MEWLMGFKPRTDKWHEGYKAGEQCDLNKKVTVPENLSKQQKHDWNNGFDAAVCDRLS